MELEGFRVSKSNELRDASQPLHERPFNIFEKTVLEFRLVCEEGDEFV